MNRSFLDHSQPSNIQVAGDMLVLAAAVAAGVAFGVAELARNSVQGLVQGWLR